MKFLKKNIQSIRFIVAFLFLGIIISGYFISSYIGGSYCSLSVFGVSFICPLGFLQTFLATGSLSIKALTAFLSVLALIIIFGRIFCAWLCPTVVIGKSNCDIHKKENHKKTPKGSGAFIILGVASATTFIFGFPVFCLICPVGLFFGLIFSLLYLFGAFKLSWGLFVFPILLVLEFTLLKRWCHSFCPLGAILGLLSKLNFFIKPKTNQSKCYSAAGKHCKICTEVCPENIDIKSTDSNNLSECSKCMECWANCPSGAIEVKVFPKKGVNHE